MSISDIKYLLAGFGLLLVSCNQKPVFKEKHYTKVKVVRNIPKDISNKDISCKDIPSSTIFTAKKKNKTPKTISFVTKRTNKYYIVAGSFPLRSAAVHHSNKYIEKGYNVYIIPSNDKYRIALYSSKEKDKADSVKKQLKAELNKSDLWLLAY